MENITQRPREEKSHVTLSLSAAISANKKVVALLEEDRTKKSDIGLEQKIELEYSVIETLSTEQREAYESLYTEWKTVKSGLPEPYIGNYMPRALGIFLSKKHVDVESVKIYFRYIEDMARADKMRLGVAEMQQKIRKTIQRGTGPTNISPPIDRGMLPTMLKAGKEDSLAYHMKVAVKPTFPDMIRAGRQSDTLHTTQVVKV